MLWGCRDARCECELGLLQVSRWGLMLVGVEWEGEVARCEFERGGLLCSIGWGLMWFGKRWEGEVARCRNELV